MTDLTNTIKTDKYWRRTFDSAVYWEEIRDRLWTGDGSEDNEEKYSIAQEQFLHYWIQFGIDWETWEAIKEAI